MNKWLIFVLGAAASLLVYGAARLVRRLLHPAVASLGGPVLTPEQLEQQKKRLMDHKDANAVAYDKIADDLRKKLEGK